MALTRSAGRALAGDHGGRRQNPSRRSPSRRSPSRRSPSRRSPSRRNPSRRNPSRRSRASFSRRNDLSDDSTPSDDDANPQAVANDITESDTGGSPQPPSRGSARSATDKSGPRRSLRRSTRKAASRNPRTKQAHSNITPTKGPRPAAKKNNSKRSPPSNTSPVSPNKRHKPAVQDDGQMPQAIVPNWQDPRIPYSCWANIFLYAGSEGNTDIPATNWLLHASTTCKMFAEPALTAVYRCPVIRHPSKAKRLAALLERDPAETLFNYRAKIESLHIDIHVVPQTILYQLIQPLTRLKELVIFTPMDQPPYRKLDANVRWHYPEDIFRALGPAPVCLDPVVEKPFPTHLKSWEWSGRLMGGFVATIEDISRIHQTPSFSRLTRLSFTNFQVPSLRDLRLKPDDEDGDYHEDGAVIEAIGHAISQLKSLKHLVFESSTVMADRLLPLLPNNLVHLELINCWEIKSEDLAAFLRTHGGHLRTLTLLHNQSLNLAFLTDLAETCPNLRELHMNLSYYRHHDSVNDADPMYDFTLLPDQVPKWPSSLRVLDIEHIRNWSVEAAEMFVQSLIDNGHNLPDLRHLAIKSMLDIPWQARAAWRGKWRFKMERVFLRPFVPPNNWTTLQEEPDTVEEAPESRKRKRGTPPRPPSRRSGRIAAHSHADSDSRRGHKLPRHQHGRPLYREPDTDEDEFDVTEVSDDEEEMSVDSKTSELGEQINEAEPAIQGLCNTVSILCDNQKVREMQYCMEDFRMDDAEDSEEEWDGDYDEDESIVIF